MNVSDIFSTLLKIRRVVAIVSILAGAGYKLTPMVWHKSDAKPAMTASAATSTNTFAGATNTILHDLGEVSLTNHSETCVQLGGGKNCILSPKVIDRGNLEITFALESKTKAGKIHDLSVAQVVTRSGKSVDVAVGDFNLTLTPVMAPE